MSDAPRPLPEGLRTETSIGPDTPDEALWFCPSCRTLHTSSSCPRRERPWNRAPSCLAAPVHLCAACARTVVRRAARQDPFFCPDCLPRVVEISRLCGRPVVPICLDEQATAELLALPGRRDDVSTPLRVPGFPARLDLLAEVAGRRAFFLHEILHRDAEAPVPLTTYLKEVATLRAERFQADAALRDLASAFHEWAIDVPADSPRLAARVRAAARSFVEGLSSEQARSLLSQGRAIAREELVRWAWATVDELVPPWPAQLEAGNLGPAVRRGHTVEALVQGALRELERLHGGAWRPEPPTAPPELRIDVQAVPGACWPEDLPEEMPEDAELLVGLEDAPSACEAPLGTYHLSTDERGDRWVLWGQEEVEEHFLDDAPAAWCARSELSSRDAAFLLLEAHLRACRAAFGWRHRRPRIGMPGFLDADVVDVLLDRVWPPLGEAGAAGPGA